MILCYYMEGSSVEVNKAELIQLLDGESGFAGEKTVWGRPVENEEKMVMTTREELGKVVEIVWTYIDTFGARHKNNVYADLEKRNPTSYNIEKLINTVNWIIYNETVGFRCNQIETANWTCFEMKAKGNFQCDRKDIVLTAHGRIKMVHLLLLDRVEDYTKEYDREVKELMADCRKNYAAGEIVAYQIED